MPAIEVSKNETDCEMLASDSEKGTDGVPTARTLVEKLALVVGRSDSKEELDCALTMEFPEVAPDCAFITSEPESEPG